MTGGLIRGGGREEGEEGVGEGEKNEGEGERM